MAGTDGAPQSPASEKPLAQETTFMTPPSSDQDRTAEEVKLPVQIETASLAMVQESLDQINQGIGRMADSMKELISMEKSNPRVSGTDEEKQNENEEGSVNGEVKDMESNNEASEEPLEDATVPKSRSFPSKPTLSLRTCKTLDAFKNFRGKEEGNYCIEVLLSNTSAKVETKKSGEDSGVADSEQSQPKARGESGNQSWIKRVRINSEITVRTLGEMTLYTQTRWDEPLVFQRPFKFLIYFHQKVKEKLTDLERGQIKNEGKTANSMEHVGQEDSSGADVSDSDSNNTIALQELRFYVRFVEERILPDFNRLRCQDVHPPPSKVRFEDLWYLFNVGDLVYLPNTARSSTSSTGKKVMHEPLFSANRYASTRSHADQKILKVLHNVGRDFVISEKQGDSVETCVCYLYCYYIDFDGEAFGPILLTVEIVEFEGSCEITELPIYPLRYANGWANLLDESKSSGIAFLRHISNDTNTTKHYSGWTLGRSPLGDEIEIMDKRTEKYIKTPEHIESTVLVDFIEAFQANPAWKPVLDWRRIESPDIFSNYAKDDLKEWTDSKPPKLVCTYYDEVVLRDGIDTLERNEFVSQGHFLTCGSDQQPQVPRDEDLALLPRRMFAYALWDRKFVIIDVQHLQGSHQNDKSQHAFKKLQIEQEAKDLIEGLIESHFLKKRDEARASIASQDLIRGKGKGIIILLHGVPGVGKTATAEAVAERFNKPLFPITCGDLGFTPTSVENSLNEMFRLAHLWDCILLLDEAEVFITQRNKDDLQRNALVSVFLRMLEYYNGILFLTTNRPGVLDEAVKSRVHLSLRYDALTKDQTKAIFKLNIERLKEIEEQRHLATSRIHKRLEIDGGDILEFADKHFERHSQGIGRWNGRQIRNAFLIASSLGHFEGDKKGLTKRLDANQFRKVEETTRMYDEYRQGVLGRDDSFQAKQRQERYDDWDPAAAQKMRDRRQSVHSAQPGFQSSHFGPTAGQQAGHWNNTIPQYPGHGPAYPGVQQYAGAMPQSLPQQYTPQQPMQYQQPGPSSHGQALTQPNFTPQQGSFNADPRMSGTAQPPPVAYNATSPTATTQQQGSIGPPSQGVPNT